MYKKLISYLLTVAILLSGNSLLFAQQIDYKPALSFEYDYFTLGKTNENDFVAKLKQDMYDNLYDSTSGPSNPYSKRESNVQKAYNNFLYYSMYPKKSPYWKYTAFEPDGVASEDDVLLILQKHKELSKEIEKLLKQNPEYKNKLANKRTLLVSGGFVLAALSVALWEIIPAASVAAPASAGEAVSTAAKVGFGMKMAKAAKFLTVLGIDVASTDWMAYKIRTLEGIKENINDVDIYKSAIIENINERNLLKSQIENYQIQICSEAVENFNNMRTAYVATNGRAPVINEMRKWEPIAHFCNGSKRQIGDKQFRLDLGQYLIYAYSKTEAPEDYIEYVRKEMTAIYHALLFIKEELSDTNDRLRFDRAFLDIVTAYKIAQIVISDNRILGSKKPVNKFQLDLLQEKGLTEEDLSEEVAYNTTLGENYEKNYSTFYSYPALLPRAQVNYIVQKMDIHQQEIQKELDEKWEKSWNEYMKQQPFGLPK